MKPIFILTVSLLPLLFAGCKQDILGPTSVNCHTGIVVNEAHPKAAALQALMDEYVKQGIPGITLLVADSNGIFLGAAGKADIARDVDMKPCHINKLGSVTKMMLSVIALQLMEHDSLDLDAKISGYLSEAIVNNVVNAKEATIGQLMNHNSGIYDMARDLSFNLAVINNPNRSWTQEEILPYVYGKPAYFPAGTPDSLAYSNTNTLLLSLVLEKITGKDHALLMKERLFDPLGMKHTLYYNQSSPLPDSVAHGYLDLYNDGKSIQEITNLNPGSGNGYTGVYSTPEDLYRFMKALMVNKTLLSKETLEMVNNTRILNRAGTWLAGYGIHVDYLGGTPAEQGMGHGGADIGYSSGCHYFFHKGYIITWTINYGRNLPTATGDLIEKWRYRMVKAVVE